MSMKIHQLSVADALASVQATEQGLSPAQVQRRQREFGLNRMAHARRRSWLRALLKEFVHFFSIVLWLAALLAFIAEWKSPGQGMARLGYALIAVILVSGLFSFWQEYRIGKALSALRRLLPQQAQVLRDGSVLRVATEALVPGDIVLFTEARTDPLRRTRRPIRPSPLSLRSVAWRAVRRRSGRTATPAEAPSPANPVANISPTFPPLLGPPLALQRQKNRPVSASPLLSWTDLRRPPTSPLSRRASGPTSLDNRHLLARS